MLANKNIIILIIIIHIYLNTKIVSIIVLSFKEELMTVSPLFSLLLKKGDSGEQA